jgi:hypothetical protein
MEPPIKPMKWQSADGISGPKNPSPNHNMPQNPNDPDLNENYFGNDLDFTQWSTMGPLQVTALHTRSDADTGPHSQHHTLGFTRNQAASGSHTHDGISSRKMGADLALVLTGAKGGNVALTNLIAILKNFILFTDSTT